MIEWRLGRWSGQESLREVCREMSVGIGRGVRLGMRECGAGGEDRVSRGCRVRQTPRRVAGRV